MTARDDSRPGGARLLKGNVKRSVYLEVDPVTGERSVVKVFHAPGASRLRDRWRATREARAHGAARRAGLPCAASLGVAAGPAGPKLRLTWIDSIGSLGQVLRARPRPLRRAALGRALAELALAAEAAGFVHHDPHPDNLLVDAAGRLHLVDLAGARVGAPGRRVARQWVRVCARLRELDPRLLAAADARWRRAGGGRTADPSSAVDAAARRLRIRETRRRVRVWLRASSATELGRRDGRRTVVNRRGAPAGWTRRRLEGEEAAVAAAWAVLVRAHLHGLPTALPLARALEAPWFVEYAAPAGMDEGAAAPDRVLARELARRGLTARGPLLSGPVPDGDAHTLLSGPVPDGDAHTLIGPGTRLVRAEGDR